MEKDTLRMQFLSGVITESEYKVKLQENTAPIFDVVTMDGKTMVGTHQYGVGFKANKKGIEMGFKDDPKSIPNKTKKVEEKAKAKVNVGESLNESMIGGIVGIGAINQIPPRAKADYETAFEYFLGEKYGLNEEEKINEGEQTIRSKSIKDYILSQIKLYPMYSAQLKSFESNIKNNQDLTGEEAKEIIEKFIKITRRTEDVFDAEMKNIKNIDYQTDRDQMAAIQGGYY